MQLIKKALCVVCVLSIVLSFFACNSSKSEQKYTKTYISYFDTVATVIGYFKSEEEFNAVAELVEERLSEYHRLYDIYTRYDGITNLADVNMTVDGEHRVLEVDRKVIDLLLFAKEMYTLTGGETNIAMGSVLSIWHYHRTAASKNPTAASLPSEDKLVSAAEHTDINDLIINEEELTVYISDPEMTLDVGAVAKGYATEMIARELENMGVCGVTLNIGGNVRTIGTKPDGEYWVVGVENPDSYSDEAYLEYVRLSGEAFVTSGSYQRYYYYGGKSYHHIIDKDTLYPSEYYISVSVLCPDSGIADSLSTALFSLSFDEGLALVESIDSAEAMWVTQDGERLYSSGFSDYIK